MPIVNFTNPITILLALVLFVLVFYLAKEVKKGYVCAIMLFIFLAVLVGHGVKLYFVDSANETAAQALGISMAVDFVFIFLSFISYLWIDDIQAKKEKKKSIDDSLSWFWAKV